MKRILTGILLLFGMLAQAQDLKNNLYYYGEQQVQLPINHNAFMVLSQNPVDLGTIFQQHGYSIDTTREGTTDTLGSTWWQVVKISNANLTEANYNTLRHQLKTGNNLIVEPVLDDETLSPFTHYFYVKLKNEADTPVLDSVIAVTGSTLVRGVPNTPLWYELKTNTNSMGNCLELANYFYETGLFDNTEPGFLFTFELAACTTLTPDLDYSLQWGLENSSNSTYDINACEAWVTTKGSSNVKVAIFDAGLYDNDPNSNPFQAEIPEYANNLDITSTSNSYDAETQKFPAQYRQNNHGMWSGGIIAANHDGQHMMGIAPNTTLMDITFDDKQKTDPLKAAATMTAGMNHAWQNGADVINCSWGSTGNPNSSTGAPLMQSFQFENAITDALTKGRGGKGCVLVFASHNDAWDAVNQTTIPNKFRYPVTKFSDEVLCVGNMTKYGEKNDQSNYGTLLDIMAPGTDIWSTAGLVYNTQTAMGYTTGTSFAAPHVSGVAALMLAVNSCLSQEDVRTIIESTAQKANQSKYTYSQWPNRPNGTWNNEMGYGLLDAKKAVDVAQAMYKPLADVYIKDQPTDMGIEPNPATNTWVSEDIWIRNVQDGITEHQNPIYDPTKPVYVYVRVRNKGCGHSGTQLLRVHWHEASAASNTWEGHWTQPSVMWIDGGFVNQTLVTIPNIPPGGEAIVYTEWYLPPPSNYTNNFSAAGIGNPHYCLLARIEQSSNIEPPGDLNVNIRQNNNIARKNVTVINFDAITAGLIADHGTVGIGNYSDTDPVSADLEFRVPENEGGNPITAEAEVSIILDNNSWSKWVSGGMEGSGFTVIDATQHILRATGDYTRLNGFAFNASEKSYVAVRVNFLTEKATTKKEFLYDLVQLNSSNGNVIGGERFEIIKPERTEGEMFFASGQYNSLNPSTIELNATSISEPADYKWYTLDTTLVDTGVTANVAPAQNTTYLLEITADEDGYKDYAEVSVPAVSQNYIVSLSPNPATGSVTASYHLDNSVQSASLTVVAANNPTQTLLNQALNIQQTQVTLNTSSLQPGIYIVNLVCGSNIKDGEQLVIQ